MVPVFNKKVLIKKPVFLPKSCYNEGLLHTSMSTRTQICTQLCYHTFGQGFLFFFIFKRQLSRIRPCLHKGRLVRITLLRLHFKLLPKIHFDIGSAFRFALYTGGRMIAGTTRHQLFGDEQLHKVPWRKHVSKVSDPSEVPHKEGCVCSSNHLLQ